ncbi:hypothetical protein V8D89_001272 [Ganoderma adspersum]
MAPRQRLVKHILHAGHLRRVNQIIHNLPPWAPYASTFEWELAEWIIESNTSQRYTDKLLKLSLYSHRRKLNIARAAAPDQFSSASKSNTAFLKALDSLPGPVAEWMLYEITVNGTCLDEYSKKMTEVLDLWVHDPMAVIADLIGNPEFKDDLTYEPSWMYEEENGKIVEEFVNNMPSAKWMWELQKLLPKGATIIPVILASDKTQLSTFSGDKVAWPVYLTIGNISKSIRKCPSHRAVALLGYLPASKLQCFSSSERSLEGYRLFHHAMSIILQPLIKAGREGQRLTCTDGGVRHIYPILAAYLADHPEQCLVTCSKENRCPVCVVPPDQCGEPLASCYHDPDASLAAMQNPAGPFWADLPYANIFTCIAPDLLHQLHKGVFKNHLVKWVSTNLEDKLDARMMRIPPYQGLRLFKKGISGILQWTGNKYQQMERIFIGAICGMHPAAPRVLASARAILDSIFIAHLPSHSTTSLHCLSDTLSTFHLNKDIFIELGIRPHFNIPKLHWLLHYLQSIVNVGACNGLSTDISERLHIDLAKMGYQASNRKAYLEQMVVWLTHCEKLQMQQSYLQWTQATSITPPPSLYPDELPFASVTALPDEATAEAPSADRVQSASTFITVERAVSNMLVEEAGSGDVEADGELDGADGEVADDLDHLSYKINFLMSESPSLARCPPPQLLPALYPVFRQFSLVLPSHHGRCIWSSPAQKRQDAHYNTVLIRKDLEHGQQVNCRVAHVHLIFSLPPHLQNLRAAHHEAKMHLAYIEWFTPFLAEPEPVSGLYRTSRSFVQQQTHASIIPVTSILCSCHLIPVWGEHVDYHWTSSTVLDVCDDFFLNTFSDHNMYSFIHLNSNATN